MKDLPVPERIGKYRVDSVLGQGAMGIVYKGFDEAIERPVAIKTIRLDLLDTGHRDDFLARFKQEAKAVGRCLHPNIVAVFDFGEDHGMPFLVMEYVEGEELYSYLKQNIALNLRKVIEISGQVLSALEYAHSQGVVHRDVKPANILMLSNGKLKVTDFGIARLEQSDLTQTGAILGTPNYMPPEQFMGNEVCHLADLYAVGVLMYELFAGNPPFKGRNSSEVMFNILNKDPDLSPPGRTIPPTFKQIIRRALAKQPGDRFQNATEFREVIEKVNLQKEMEATSQGSEEETQLSVQPAGGTEWMPDILKKVERNLASVVGPIAKVMVKKAAKDAESIQELCENLTQHIDDDADRTRFMSDMEKTVSRGQGRVPTHAPMAIDQQTLTLIEEELMPIIGPIAKVLVKRESDLTVSQQELVKHLADHIPNETERTVFLKRFEKPE